jgi:hypothetical protein
MKKLIWDKVDNVDGYDFDGTIVKAIARLESLAATHGGDAKLDWGQHDQYDEGYSFAIEVEREETDYEYSLRLERDQVSEAYERQQYERLKKRFGDED